MRIDVDHDERFTHAGAPDGAENPDTATDSHQEAKRAAEMSTVPAMQPTLARAGGQGKADICPPQSGCEARGALE